MCVPNNAHTPIHANTVYVSRAIAPLRRPDQTRCFTSRLTESHGNDTVA